jgi:hypothetical protein
MGVVRWTRTLRVIGLSAALLGAAQAARAQTAVYGIAGPAGVSGFFRSSRAVHAAGGADVLAAGPVGVSGELGAFANTSSVLWVTSVNAVVALASTGAAARAVPFVTGGYSRFSSGEESFNAWNIGGGINAWVSERVGLRADFRDHVRPDSRGTVQYWTIRAGAVLRVR